MKPVRLSLQWKFFLVIVVIIFPTLGLIFAWAGIQNEKQARQQVINQARVLARQIILTRRWVTDSGGLWVAENSKGDLKSKPTFHHRMDTVEGGLIRFSPSMVTKRLSQYSSSQELYSFRLASLNPINPENLADGFEKSAITAFKQTGVTEMYRFDPQLNSALGPAAESIRDSSHFHYMVPLYLEKACLDCHHRKGDSQNVIRGGLSVFLPVERLEASIRKNRLELALFGAGLVLLTSFTLFVLMRRFVIKPLSDFETMASEISAGNLEARVKIATGDEFEQLGRAFNNMARRLLEGRDSLQERVARATRELSQANRELKTLDKLKSDFLANMSHELRSPLTVIRGGIDYLSRTIRIEENRNYLSIIDKNLSRLIHLVTDLFDFTKIEALKIDWSFEHENMAVLIEEVIDILSPLALERGITIRYDRPADVMVEMDLERIEQVLVNLLDNALKFADPETEVTIALRTEDSNVTVAITDQGVGIAVENLVTIFDKFSTVPTGRDGKPEGTGLGLAICKAIVEAHRGHIWAESQPGESSTFQFTLPKRRDSVAVAAAEKKRDYLN